MIVISTDLDEACMLQVWVGATGNWRASLSSSCTNWSSAVEDEPWQNREYYLVAHHKTGTVMTKHAAQFMMDALHQAGSTVPHIESTALTMGLALNSSMMQTPAPACFAQVSRNPFEIVVSGYVYHKSSPKEELWLPTPFGEAVKHDGCEPSFVNCRMTPFCKYSSDPYYWHRRWHSMAQVSRSNLLPDPRINETYAEYLRRVPLDTGLIAEFVWALDSSLRPMLFTQGFTESKPCSTNMCFGDFYEDCNAAWQRVLGAWEIPEPHYSEMLQGATRSCPATDPGEESHSSVAQSSQSGIEQEPLYKMVERLKELDRRILNSTIAAMARQVNCRLTERYTER